MKYLYAALLICLSFSLNAQNLSNDFSSAVSSFTENVQFSDEFIKNLIYCKPFSETKSDDIIIETKYEYKIIGKKDGKCEVIFTADTEMSNFINTCRFSNEEIKDYTNALSNLKNKKIEAIEMLSDADYLTTMGIIFDENICTQEIKGLDYTSELRKNLLSCSPYKKEVNFSNTKILMEIEGKKDDKCSYKESTTQKTGDLSKVFPDGIPPELKKIMEKDIVIIFDCDLSEKDATSYAEALEKSAMKGGSISEFLDMNVDDLKTAPNMLQEFVANNICVIKDNFSE